MSAAMSDRQGRRAAIAEQFRAIYHGEPDGWVRAPGRAELLGTDTDDHLGYVLTMSIHLDTWIAFRAFGNLAGEDSFNEPGQGHRVPHRGGTGGVVGKLGPVRQRRVQGDAGRRVPAMGRRCGHPQHGPHWRRSQLIRLPRGGDGAHVPGGPGILPGTEKDGAGLPESGERIGGGDVRHPRPVCLRVRQAGHRPAPRLQKPDAHRGHDPFRHPDRHLRHELSRGPFPAPTMQSAGRSATRARACSVRRRRRSAPCAISPSPSSRGWEARSRRCCENAASSSPRRTRG